MFVVKTNIEFQDIDIKILIHRKALVSVFQTPHSQLRHDSGDKWPCNLVTLDPKHDPTVDLSSSLFFGNKSKLG